jgi:hypothetical protein
MGQARRHSRYLYADPRLRLNTTRAVVGLFLARRLGLVPVLAVRNAACV